MLSLAWRCANCSATVPVEGGALCEACQEQRHVRAHVLWKVEIALGIELGDDALEGMGPDPEDR